MRWREEVLPKLAGASGETQEIETHAIKNFATAIEGYEGMLVESLKAEQETGRAIMSGSMTSFLGAYGSIRNPLDKAAFGVIVESLGLAK